jgi:hypothetical protein
MHPVVCYLRKNIIWDSSTTNNKKETKQALLRTHVLLVVGSIATCFDHFPGPSSGAHE